MDVCFVGMGSIGQRHLRNLSTICSEDGIELCADVLRATNRELNPEISQLIKNEYQSYEKLKERYDAIFITNPTYLHYETLKRLKDKSIYFFVEKPLVYDLNQDIQELQLPRTNNYYIACPLRYTKVLQLARNFLQNHSPFSIRAISSSYLPEWRANVDYRDTYSAHKSQGGGVCIDLIHEWDYLFSFFGEPEEVFQFAGKFSELEIDSEDLAVYIARYSGFLLELHLDYFGRQAQRKLEVLCQDGSYCFDIMSGTILKDDEVIQMVDEKVNDKYIAEMTYFLELCRGKVENVNDIEHALNVLKITSGK